MTDDVDGQLAEPITAPDAQPADTSVTPSADAAPADTQPEPATTPDAAPAEPVETKRTPWWQSRIDQITAQRYEEANARKAAEARAQALESLLSAQGVDTSAVVAAPPSGAPVAPSSANPTEFQRAVAAEAARVAAQVAFDQKCNEVYERGTTQFPDFDLAVKQLGQAGILGANAGPAGVEFLEAALATEAPEALLNKLGQDPAEAMRVAQLPPYQRAIQLDRMARELAAPKSRPVSSAPAPIAPLDGGRVSKAFDPYDPNVSSDDWFREMDRRDAEKRGRA